MIYQGFINFVIFSFILAGFIFIFGNPEWFPDFYRLNFMSVLAFIYAALIISIARIFKSDKPEKRESIVKLQAAVSAVVLLDGLGALGLFKLYRIGFSYDKLAHFLSAFILIFALSQFIHQWKEIDLKKSLIRASILVFLGGLGWELLEFSSDEILKTTAFGMDGKYLLEDTVKDIALNTAGIITGVLFLLLKRKQFR